MEKFLIRQRRIEVHLQETLPQFKIILCREPLVVEYLLHLLELTLMFGAHDSTCIL